MTSKLKRRKCKQCKGVFEQQRPLQYLCGVACSLKYSKALSEKKQRRDNQTAKVAMLTHSEWLNILQKVFNTFIRVRDKDDACISCGTQNKIEYAAGHYYPTTYSSLRFNEDNVHKQCNKHCNMMLRGNLHEYKIALIKKIGQQRYDKLGEDRHNAMKLSIDEIKNLIKMYKEKINNIK